MEKKLIALACMLSAIVINVVVSWLTLIPYSPIGGTLSEILSDRETWIREPLVYIRRGMPEPYKRIVVTVIIDPEMIPCDPESWTDDSILISFIASFFGAEVIRNYPSYRYCIVRVPTAHYPILTFIYRILGYYVTDDHLLRPLLN